jgi:hypothetical protein
MEPANSPEGWKKLKLSRTDIQFSHSTFGLISITMNRLGKLEVKHNGGYIKGKSIFLNSEEALDYTLKYMDQLANGQIVGNKLSNLPSHYYTGKK